MGIRKRMAWIKGGISVGKHIDLSGKRFGRLVVTNEFLITKEGRRKWKCLCDCGIENIVGNPLMITTKDSRKGFKACFNCWNMPVGED